MTLSSSRPTRIISVSRRDSPSRFAIAAHCSSVRTSRGSIRERLRARESDIRRGECNDANHRKRERELLCRPRHRAGKGFRPKHEQRQHLAPSEWRVDTKIAPWKTKVGQEVDDRRRNSVLKKRMNGHWTSRNRVGVRDEAKDEMARFYMRPYFGSVRSVLRFWIGRRRWELRLRAPRTQGADRRQ